MGDARRLCNAFGNGVFDGWTIVRPRKPSVHLTDPDAFFGGKCAWETLTSALGGHEFAVPPFWSQNGNGNGHVGPR
jgi:hypothetical protein